MKVGGLLFIAAACMTVQLSAPHSLAAGGIKHVLVRCGPPAGDLVNGTYLTIGRSRQQKLVAQLTEYKRGASRQTQFDVKRAHCPCPRAFEGKKMRLQVSDFSMAWLTQGPKKTRYLATLELKNKPQKGPRTLGVSCQILN